MKLLTTLAPAPIDPAVKRAMREAFKAQQTAIRWPVSVPAHWVMAHVRPGAGRVSCVGLWTAYYREAVERGAEWMSACLFGRAMLAAGFVRGHTGCGRHAGPVWLEADLVNVTLAGEALAPADWLATGPELPRAADKAMVWRIYRHAAIMAGKRAVSARSAAWRLVMAHADER